MRWQNCILNTAYERVISSYVGKLQKSNHWLRQVAIVRMISSPYIEKIPIAISFFLDVTVKDAHIFDGNSRFDFCLQLT